MALSINEAFSDPSKTIWQTQAMIPPTYKCADKKYYVPVTNSEFLFSHPSPTFLAVEAVNECGWQHHTKSTSYDKDHKYFDLFGCKSYSSATLQFMIVNYKALLTKYNHTNYSKFTTFIEHLPAEHYKQFLAIITEDELLARTSSQASLNLVDIAACSVLTAVTIHWASWLQLSRCPRQFQSTSLLMDQNS